MQLNGLTGLFIASKYFEVNPIMMKELINDMCYNKYSQQQFVDRETRLMSLLACEVDPPTHFDFVLVYYKLIRFHVQALKGPMTKPGLNFILLSEFFASEYCKMILADVELMSVRPSILAASAVIFGLQSAYKYLQNSEAKKQNPPEP